MIDAPDILRNCSSAAERELGDWESRCGEHRSADQLAASSCPANTGAHPDHVPALKPPAAYYFYPLLAGAPELWGEHFIRANTMGFDSIVIASPFAADRDPAALDLPPYVRDYSRLDPGLGDGDAVDALTRAARLASAHGLRLMLDIEIGPIDQEAIEVAADHWNARIAEWQVAGIAGFRGVGIDKTPPAIWHELIGAAKARESGTMFMAWTPGLAPAGVAAVRGAGFDFSFSSSCWWDFKADWLEEDARRMASIGPEIAMAEPPHGFRCADQDGEGRLSRRALNFAAHYAPGWLVPMGFEYGAGADLHRASAQRPGEAFKRLEKAPRFDLRGEIARANAAREQTRGLASAGSAMLVSSPGANVALVARPRAEDYPLVLAANPSLETPVSLPRQVVLPLFGGAGAKLAPVVGETSLSLAPAGVTVMVAQPAPAIVMAGEKLPDCAAPRIAIEAITPRVEDGQFPVRRIVGETVTVEADILADGHDRLAANLLWREADRHEWQSVPMELVANDRWRAGFPLERMGRYQFAISAWWDEYGTIVDHISKKHAAGADISLDLRECVELVVNIAKTANDEAAPLLGELVAAISNADQDVVRQLLLADQTTALLRRADPQRFLVQSSRILLDAERRGAAFASWYEIFPRSQSEGAAKHGTFRDVMARLPVIRDMGFDVLYFPPIHPIGRINRKGRNNSLVARADDPGSPYAIGAEEGGHAAIHPELGSFEDFHALLEAAATYGIEIALDFAIQCAPDHPWLKEHPEWFDWRSDGSLRYAENPPKKYEDIVNVDFYGGGAMPALWLALRDVVQFWVDHGVRIFRVDNPHTKPMPFWQWMIGDIRARHPDVIFLAEAFTRPKIMYRLSQVGFSQSYTYFTWRNTKQELTEYLTELTTTAPKEFFRPHFFVNTPDINPLFLQTSGRAGFLIRAVLAATLSGLWGVYNGFELCESAALPGKEEYAGSEKYEIRHWDHNRPGNIIAEITRLNHIRRSNRALHSHLNVQFLPASGDQILCFLKTAPDGNAILVAVNLDPFNAHRAQIELPLDKLGVPADGVTQVADLMRGNDFTLYGRHQQIELSPHEWPFHVWRLHAASGQERLDERSHG